MTVPSHRQSKRSQSKRRHSNNHLLGISAAITLTASMIGPSNAAPPIRMSASNPIPACVTPERLMMFLTQRNTRLDPRFNSIARWYKYWGDAWRVRWDYAFFQMLLETNYLTYRRPDGRRGDVHEGQNNFAGIGATGGGVPGNRFPDVATGVHAQIQHLVAYSGERLAQPIAPRTEFAQDDIISKSQALRRDVTFGDLARRWAVDRHYARSIDAVAQEFRDSQCGRTAATSPPRTEVDRPVPAPQPAVRRRLDAFAPPSGLGGPKPQQLAGPETEPAETLPWLTQTTPAPTRVPSARPARIAPTQATFNAVPQLNSGQKPLSQPSLQKAVQAGETVDPKKAVRTIWRRNTVNPSSAAPITTDDAAPSTSTPAAQLPTNSLVPTATSLQSPPPDPAVDTLPRGEPTTGDGSFFSLPTFRIAPSTPPPPSRLGGPLPPPVAAVTTGDAPPLCRVVSASYGGRKTLLVRSVTDGKVRLTALTVHDGFEKSMFETFAKASAPNAEIISTYDTQSEALADAHLNCDR